MSILFSPLRIGGVDLPNRIAVAPMCQYSAVDGCMTDWHRMHLLNLAVGAPGLVMIEATGVVSEGRISPACPGLYNDEQQARLAEIVAICKRYAGQPVGIQLAHAGRKGSSDVPWRGGRPVPLSAGGWSTVAPSAVPFSEKWPTPVAMDQAAIDQTVKAFAAAARRAIDAGCDVLEIHAAHGYLLHEFLSPLTNVRTDGYGGSPEARMRFPLEVIAAVRAVCPQARALGVRLTGSDWSEQGIGIDEAVRFASAARQAGADYACVTSGGIRPDIPIAVSPGYQVGFASEIRRRSGIVTRAVGMILDGRQAQQLIADGHADQVAIARGFLDEPRWVWRAAEQLGVRLELVPQYRRAAADTWPGHALVHHSPTPPTA
jgi:2,4-dienoyl-CoA reductase-like NADH-dependent reductase (Old Yellow Enzyme family)